MGNDRNWKREMKKMGVTTVKAFSNRAGCGNEEPGLQASVVLQPLLLCQGEDQLFVTKTNGKATEIVSVHSNWWSELPHVYREEFCLAIMIVFPQ